MTAAHIHSGLEPPVCIGLHHSAGRSDPNVGVTRITIIILDEAAETHLLCQILATSGRAVLEKTTTVG